MFRSGNSEVSSMDENVAVWERWLRVVGVVGVRYANDMDFVWPLFKLDWRSVEQSGEK
jgi:hypothetical protein